ncbi:MAG: hypothetical protein ACLTXO_10820, partial [Fusobacterium varium]
MLYQGKIFKNQKFIINHLLAYGFIQKDDQYIYSVNLMKNSFTLNISIKIPNEIKIKIIDLETNEEYIPAYIQNINGGFVGKIQKECESVLTDIAEKCTIKKIFKSDYAKKIIKYIS